MPAKFFLEGRVVPHFCTKIREKSFKLYGEKFKNQCEYRSSLDNRRYSREAPRRIKSNKCNKKILLESERVPT